MTVNLLGLSVLLEQTTQDAHAVHPQQLLGHTGIGRTFPLAVAAVTSLTAGQRVLADAETGVHHDGLLDDQTILDQLADALAGVGVSNLVDFVRIQPDLLLATSHNRGCEPLLKLEGTESRNKNKFPLARL
uniref:Secreted protein n=1 Tax=Aedes albopictus TaxID=7160 RepID=A0A1W7R4X6_AEDAL